MRTFIRGFVYSYLAITIAHSLLNTFAYLDIKSFWMIVIAFALLNTFKNPMLELVSLSIKFPMFNLYSFFLSAILLNILVAIIPDFKLMSATTPSFNILGYVVGSKYLTPFLSGVAASLTISLISDFFYWLGAKKK